MEELYKKLEGTHFSIDDNPDKKAYNFNKNDRKTDKETVMRWFLNRCASKDVIRVFCQIDGNEKGQYREGLTTYGVETKSQELLTIYIYSAYNDALKDEMNMLNNAVKNAQERIKRKQDIARKIIIGSAIVTVGTIASFTGFKYVLDKFGSPKEDTSISMTTEEKVEEQITEQVIESTPIEQMSAEQIQQSIDNYNQKQINQQLNELQQDREELNLNSGETSSISNDTGNVSLVNNFVDAPVQNFSYGYNEVVGDATKTQAVMNEYNQQQIEQQQANLNELRQR